LFFLMVVLAYCWQRGRKWIPVWSLAAALPLLAIFNLLGHNRYLLQAALSGEPVQAVTIEPGLSRTDKIKKQLDTQDFANFDYLAYVVSVVPDRTHAYSYGLQYLQLFTEPIPRMLWPTKPVGAPVKTISLGAYGNFVGLTVSLCG